MRTLPRIVELPSVKLAPLQGTCLVGCVTPWGRRLPDTGRKRKSHVCPGAETCGAGNRFTGGANKMAVTSTQSCEPKMHLREGAIYKDSSNNIIRLLSIRRDYCVYAYVALGNSRAEMHGPISGLTRRNAFEAGFLFAAECLEEWKSSQHKCSAQTFHIPSSLDSIDFGARARASRKKVIALPQFSSRQRRLSA